MAQSRNQVKAIAFIKHELKRGLPVYLFEVADFFQSHAFHNAREVVKTMEAEGMMSRDNDPDPEVFRYLKGPKFDLLA